MNARSSTTVERLQRDHFNPVLNRHRRDDLQVTSAYQDVSNTFDPGGRLGQISWRINWWGWLDRKQPDGAAIGFSFLVGDRDG